MASDHDQTRPTDPSSNPPSTDPKPASRTTRHDLVVLGGGSGGYAAALRAAQLGMDVVLVERDRLGGTCLHRGCVPAKALLHAAEVADTVRRAGEVGVRASFEGVDAAAVRDHTAAVVSRLHTGLTGLVRQRGIEVVEGTGRLVREGSGVAVETGGRRLVAPHVVLATGSRPRTLGLPVDHRRILTSDDALWLDTLPQRAIVLGGGVIGVELASAWAGLGVEVTLVEALDRLVPSETPEISRALRRAFERRGITVLTGTPIEQAVATPDSSTPDGTIQDTATEDGATQDGTTSGDGVRVRLADGSELSADVLLVAVGREPVTEALDGLVELDGPWVRVDDTLQTSVPGVFAVGDLVRGPQLAHRGFGHGMFVAEHLAHRAGTFATRPRLQPDAGIPRITYSHPEVLSVGVTPDQAREQGEVEVVQYDLTGNGRAQILHTQGFVQVVRWKDGPVAGVHVIGDRVGELAGEAQLVVNWQALPEEVAEFVHAHPTLDEALGEAMLALSGRPLHAH